MDMLEKYYQHDRDIVYYMQIPNNMGNNRLV